jgi:hypothetical protein
LLIFKDNLVIITSLDDAISFLTELGILMWIVPGILSYYFGKKKMAL